MEEKKLLKILILGFSVASVAILLKEIILNPREKEIVPSHFRPHQVKIDFEFLKKEQLKDLIFFKELTLPKEFGRENPFQPYSTKEETK